MHAVDQRYAGPVHLDHAIRTAGNFQCMPGQSETGHIGQGVHAVQRRQLGPRRIELGGHRKHAGVAGFVQLFLFERSRQNAHAQRLAQNQPVAHAGIGIALDALGVHQPQSDQPVNGLHRIDGVATGNRDAGRLAHGRTPSQDLADGFQREHIDGHAHQRQRHDGRAAHGVHVRNRIGRRDTPKVKRVINDGHEEVGGGNQRLFGIELVDRRVVRSLDPHQQLRRQRHGGGGLENLRQHARRDLATTAASVGERSQAWFSLGLWVLCGLATGC